MSESKRFAHMFDKSIEFVRKWLEIRVTAVNSNSVHLVDNSYNFDT